MHHKRFSHKFQELLFSDDLDGVDITRAFRIENSEYLLTQCVYGTGNVSWLYQMCVEIFAHVGK